MKTKNIKTDDLVQVPESVLVALVLSQIRGISLFPKKVEAAKKYLKLINEIEAG